MFSSQQQLLLGLALLCLSCGCLCLEDQLDVIKEDVISIANETQKVIRVNPLELPSKLDHTGNKMNSALFQVQSLKPGFARQYLDSKRMRRPRPVTSLTGEAVKQLKYTPELKPFPKQKKKKQLHFIVQPTSSDDDSSESQALPVEVAPGAYPVYYVVSKTNGRFGKFPIKSFRSQSEFKKYLLKSKAEPIPRALRFEPIASIM